MRLMVGTSLGEDQPSVFRLDAGGALDLTATLPAVGRDLSALAADPALAAEAAAVSGMGKDPGAVRPALPIARPGKVVCLGLNYAEHAAEGGFEVPDYPALFLRVQSSLVPAEAPLIRPRASETFDYEAELMIVVGKGGRHIAEADAPGHIFGYTTFNDGSIRKYQRMTHQWTPGKNFDATGAIGPVVATADALPADAKGLRIQTRLNGETLQDSSTADMIFAPARTIAILSEVMTLEPGDLIALGTPPGVGHARRPPVWMKPGDTVEVEIEGIGICRNPVVDEDAAHATAE
ncbi:MAG: fumarylacetoacetate hydrolase family protein [Pseudomonadota bacterium]